MARASWMATMTCDPCSFYPSLLPTTLAPSPSPSFAPTVASGSPTFTPTTATPTVPFPPHPSFTCPNSRVALPLSDYPHFHCSCRPLFFAAGLANCLAVADTDDVADTRADQRADLQPLTRPDLRADATSHPVRLKRCHQAGLCMTSPLFLAAGCQRHPRQQHRR
jgi:hypothetical protein